jgi:cell division protein FtsA
MIFSDRNFTPTRTSRPAMNKGKGKVYAGLEIGTSKIALVVGEVRPDGTIKILGRGQTSSTGVRKGEIVDMALARTCLGEAIQTAEANCDTTITAVLLSITGSHIHGGNVEGQIRLPENSQVGETDLQEVKNVARDAVNLPQSNVFIHTIARHYTIDGQEQVRDPLGRQASILGANIHVIHGIRNRMMNTIRCVRDYSITVVDAVFAPLASAQMVLNRETKNQGALLIDIGGGTSDWVLYHDGVVSASGSFGVGGDHITADLSIVFKMPIFKAERLKVEFGSAIVEDAPSGAVLRFDHGGDDIDQRQVNEVIHCRVRETLEKIRRAAGAEGLLDTIRGGVYLTGGTSLLKGIDRVAQDVFKMPVHRYGAAHNPGVTAAFEDPCLSTAIGLIRYHQFQEHERRSTSRISRFKDAVKNFFNGMANLFSF